MAGFGPLIFEVLAGTTPDTIICLAGVSSGGRKLEVNADSINNSMVPGNGVVFGPVNANRRWHEALVRQPTDIKTVISVCDSVATRRP